MQSIGNTGKFDLFMCQQMADDYHRFNHPVNPAGVIGDKRNLSRSNDFNMLNSNSSGRISDGINSNGNINVTGNGNGNVHVNGNVNGNGNCNGNINGNVNTNNGNGMMMMPHYNGIQACNPFVPPIEARRYYANDCQTLPPIVGLLGLPTVPDLAKLSTMTRMDELQMLQKLGEPNPLMPLGNDKATDRFNIMESHSMNSIGETKSSIQESCMNETISFGSIASMQNGNREYTLFDTNMTNNKLNHINYALTPIVEDHAKEMICGENICENSIDININKGDAKLQRKMERPRKKGTFRRSKNTISWGLNNMPNQ